MTWQASATVGDLTAHVTHIGQTGEGRQVYAWVVTVDGDEIGSAVDVCDELTARVRAVNPGANPYDVEAVVDAYMGRLQ